MSIKELLLLFVLGVFSGGALADTCSSKPLNTTFLMYFKSKPSKPLPNICIGSCSTTPFNSNVLVENNGQFYSTYKWTGTACTGGGSDGGSLTPDGDHVDPDKHNYCYSPEYINDLITETSKCVESGGSLVHSCDPDTQKPTFKCSGGSDKPDDGSNPDPNTVDHLLHAYDSGFKWENTCRLDLIGGNIEYNLDCFSQIADLQKLTTHALANANQLVVKNAVEKLNLEARNNTSTLKTGLDNIINYTDKTATNTGALIAPVRDISQTLKGLTDSEITTNAALDKLLANSNTTQKYYDGWDNAIFKMQFNTDAMVSNLKTMNNNIDGAYNQLGDFYSQLSSINYNGAALLDKTFSAKISPKAIQTGVTNALKAHDALEKKQGDEMSKGFLNGFNGDTNAYLKKYDDAFNSTDNPLAGKTFSNPIENVFVGSNTCEPITITLFGHSAEMVDHCRVMGVLNKFLVLIMWVWCGIAIYNDAARIYLAVTTD
ncbi:hypothetical protein [Photobacterium leiognathi]|uniref:hypothetical protein n=1 Tax=Photobacterium leiognathi TaxID=553611 RepID=UPI0029829A36|nr:hypothetical protein [Photobacterium leiognathi]